MPITVGLPDGKTAQFPDGMSPDDIQKAIESDPTYGRPGVPSSTPSREQFAGQMKPVPLPAYGSAALATGDAIKNAGIGVLKGAGSTANNIGHLALPDWALNASNKYLGTKINVPSAQQQDSYFAPSDTAQAVGKGVEQVGEFLAPGGLEEKGAAKLAELTPKLGKYAAPLARIATGALSSGAVNAAQGGSPVAGAVMGASGGVVGEGLRALAPPLAASALNVGWRDRLYGRTPAEAILQDTKGFAPGTVADSAKQVVNTLTPQLEGQAVAAGNAGARGSLAPARNGVEDLIQENRANRAMGAADELLPLQNHLATDQLTKLPLAEKQAPIGLLNLKRGINSEFIGRWNPNAPKGPLTAAKSAYGAINNEFHAAAPGTADLDQRISSLIPVMQRAEQADLNASILQRSMGRIGRPTGALAGALAGGALGYKEGGIPQAAKDATIGLFAPEILSNPTTLMMGARALNTGMTPVVRTLIGGGLQANRQNLYNKPK